MPDGADLLPGAGAPGEVTRRDRDITYRSGGVDFKEKGPEHGSEGDFVALA